MGAEAAARDPLKPCGDEGPTELASEFTRKFPGHWFVDEETGRRSPGSRTRSASTPRPGAASGLRLWRGGHAGAEQGAVIVIGVVERM